MKSKFLFLSAFLISIVYTSFAYLNRSEKQYNINGNEATLYINTHTSNVYLLLFDLNEEYILNLDFGSVDNAIDMFNLIKSAFNDNFDIKYVYNNTILEFNLICDSSNRKFLVYRKSKDELYTISDVGVDEIIKILQKIEKKL